MSMRSQVPLITITSATKLTPEQQKAAEALVVARAGKATVKFAIDPLVLGGVKVEIGSQIFDATLEGQLKQLALPGNTCTITTAVPLTPSQRKLLITTITQRHGSVTITEKVNPDVIGGIKVVIGSKEYDKTIAGKLNRLQSHTLTHL